MTASDYEAKIKALEESGTRLADERDALMKEYKLVEAVEAARKKELGTFMEEFKKIELRKRQTVKEYNKAVRQRRGLKRKLKEKEAEIANLPRRIRRYKRILEGMRRAERPAPAPEAGPPGRLGEVLGKIVGVPG